MKSELNQEADQLKFLCELGTGLSQSEILTNVPSLLDTVKDISAEFDRLQSSVSERYVPEVYTHEKVGFSLPSVVTSTAKAMKHQSHFCCAAEFGNLTNK